MGNCSRMAFKTRFFCMVEVSIMQSSCSAFNLEIPGEPKSVFQHRTEWALILCVLICLSYMHEAIEISLFSPLYLLTANRINPLHSAGQPYNHVNILRHRQKFPAVVCCSY